MQKIGQGELLLVIIPVFFLYFLPSIIALSRKKTNKIPIILLNLFLGWSFIGWLASLIWACTSNNKTQTIIVNNSNYSKEENSNNQESNSLNEKLEQLQKLKNLVDTGVLTQEEFNQQKSKILSSRFF